VAVEPDAEPPDITVHISAIDPARPGCLRWLVVTERFDGLPPKLEATIDLGRDTGGRGDGAVQGVRSPRTRSAPRAHRGLRLATLDSRAADVSRRSTGRSPTAMPIAR
jgi:hypothetical protein